MPIRKNLFNKPFLPSNLTVCFFLKNIRPTKTALNQPFRTLWEKQSNSINKVCPQWQNNHALKMGVNASSKPKQKMKVEKMWYMGRTGGYKAALNEKTLAFYPDQDYCRYSCRFQRSKHSKTSDKKAKTDSYLQNCLAFLLWNYSFGGILKK